MFSETPCTCKIYTTFPSPSDSQLSNLQVWYCLTSGVFFCTYTCNEGLNMVTKWVMEIWVGVRTNYSHSRNNKWLLFQVIVENHRLLQIQTRRIREWQRAIPQHTRVQTAMRYPVRVAILVPRYVGKMATGILLSRVWVRYTRFH